MSLAIVHSRAQVGVEAPAVTVEAHLANGLPALTLVGLTHGPAVAQAIQLAIQYDPEPPFDAGSPAKAPAHVGELVRAYYNCRS